MSEKLRSDSRLLPLLELLSPLLLLLSSFQINTGVLQSRFMMLTLLSEKLCLDKLPRLSCSDSMYLNAVPTHIKKHGITTLKKQGIMGGWPLLFALPLMTLGKFLKTLSMTFFDSLTQIKARYNNASKRDRARSCSAAQGRNR